MQKRSKNSKRAQPKSKQEKNNDNHERKLPNACPTEGDPTAVRNITFLWHFVAVACQPSGAKCQEAFAFCWQVPAQRW